MNRQIQSKALNRSLRDAKAAKQDEFYTQYVDIQTIKRDGYYFMLADAPVAQGPVHL